MSELEAGEEAGEGKSRAQGVSRQISLKEEEIPERYGRLPVHGAAFYGDVLQLQTALFLRSGAVEWRDGKQRATPLHHAAYGGSVDCCKLLMNSSRDKKAALNARDADGQTPLQHATVRGNFAVVKYLLECGVDVKSADDTQTTPLHRAARRGFTKIVNELLSRGADVNATDSKGRTALHDACVKSNDFRCQNILGPLLQKGADVDHQDNRGSTPWHKAALSGNTDALLFLEEHGVREKASQRRSWHFLQAHDGLMPHHCAVLSQNLQCIKTVLHKLPAELIDAPDGRGYTALHYAAFLGDSQTLKQLLDLGANASTVSKEEKSTPLLKAGYVGSMECIALLLEAGADIDAADIEGATLIHKAAFGGHTQLVRFLQKKGANLLAKDLNGSTPFHKAASGGHSGLINIMLLSGSNFEMNLTDNNGATALHNAARSGDASCVKILLDRGSDWTKRDKSGAQAIHLATASLFWEVVDIICDVAKARAGGEEADLEWDVDAKDGAGYAALYYALKQGDNDCVRVLLQHGASVEDHDLYEELLASPKLDLIRMCEELPGEVVERLNQMPMLKEAIADALVLDARDLGPRPDLEVFNVPEEHASAFNEGTELFNRRPVKGIKLLIEKGVLPRHPKEVARLLFIHSDILQLEMIGEYLGGDGKFESAVRRYFTSFINFTGLDFDLGLRRFLRKFRLPGESQKIDRLVKIYAERYFVDNRETFVCKSPDASYRLAFAVIMLNTDAHNENVRKDKKMTLAQFHDNCHALNDGDDLPESYLTDLYWRIVQNEIVMNPDSTFANAEKAGWASIRIKRMGGHRWKRRWFILSDNILFFVKAPGSQEILGSIPMEGTVVSRAVDEKAKKKEKQFFFTISSSNPENPFETIQIKTDSDRECAAWVDTINASRPTDENAESSTSPSAESSSSSSTSEKASPSSSSEASAVASSSSSSAASSTSSSSPAASSSSRNDTSAADGNDAEDQKNTNAGNDDDSTAASTPNDHPSTDD